eukprot:7299822-Heterocapsa_arctica.AAC.1
MFFQTPAVLSFNAFLTRNWSAEKAELLRVSAPLLGGCALWEILLIIRMFLLMLSLTPAILFLIFPLAAA